MFRAASSRNAYTLLELIIVLAILTSLMALAWPNVQRRLQRSLPREAALQIKAELADAREQAIRSGEAWACRYQPGTSYYQIASLASLAASSPSSEGSLNIGMGLPDDAGDCYQLFDTNCFRGICCWLPPGILPLGFSTRTGFKRRV